MSDIEIIEFKTPSGAATLLYLTQIETCGGLEESEVRSGLREHFSQWGLLYSLNISQSDDNSSHLYCYIRYYSVRATARAKIDNKGEILKRTLSLIKSRCFRNRVIDGGATEIQAGLSGERRQGLQPSLVTEQVRGARQLLPGLQRLVQLRAVPQERGHRGPRHDHLRHRGQARVPLSESDLVMITK